jgi:PAS domain-containing protein
MPVEDQNRRHEREDAAEQHLGRPLKMAGGCWIVTDRAGDITEASEEAGRLLGVPARSLQNRSLLLFFEKNRVEWSARASEASLLPRVFRARLRPRELRSIDVTTVLQALEGARFSSLYWEFQQQPSDKSAASLSNEDDDGPTGERVEVQP